jgi:hypothetical protein
MSLKRRDQIPFLTHMTLSDCACKKFQVDSLGDHLYTCTTHSGVKKDHDWVVDQISDLLYLFHNKHFFHSHQ